MDVLLVSGYEPALEELKALVRGESPASNLSLCLSLDDALCRAGKEHFPVMLIDYTLLHKDILALQRLSALGEGSFLLLYRVPEERRETFAGGEYARQENLFTLGFPHDAGFSTALRMALRFARRLAPLPHLLEKEELFRYLAEFSPFPLVIVSAKGVYEYINPRFTEVFGYGLEDLPDEKAWFKLAFPDPHYRSKVEKEWLASLEEAGPEATVQAAHIITCKGGRRCETLCRAVKTRSGKLLLSYEDMTERKKAEAKLHYISFHDQLTGLYNRAFFEEELKRLDTGRQLPLSLIVGDTNGIKLVNEAFGHRQGDELLTRAAGILKKHCRREDIVCRWGGDEFAILLPRMKEEGCKELLKRIKAGLEEATPFPIKLSMSLGSATKKDVFQDVGEVLKIAEAQMYSQKLSEAKEFRQAVIASLVRTLGEKDYETEEHSWRMQNLSVQWAGYFKLKDSELEDLIMAVTLHDIGKIAVPEEILMKTSPLSENEWAIIKEHAERGYRIAISSEELLHVAPYILFHHERWDGLGYPRGLKGEEIPLLSRILAILDAYDVMTNGRPYKAAISEAEAMQELWRCAGKQFDPHLVKILLEEMGPKIKNKV